MNYDALLEKLGSTNAQIHPVVRNDLARVEAVGLNKVAASLYGVEDITLKTATQHLSTRFMRSRLKFQKIASGIESYKFLERADAAVKNASVQLRPTAMMKNTAGNLIRGAEGATGAAAQMPKQLGGALNQGSSGMFSQFDAPAAAGFNPKATVRGAALPQMPAMRRLPTQP